MSVCYICANFIWKLAFNLCKNITQMHTMLSKLYRPMDKRCMQMDWYFCKILVLRCKMVATKSIPKAISAVYPFAFSPIVPHPHLFASTTTNICMNEHRCHSRACVALYDTNHRFEMSITFAFWCYEWFYERLCNAIFSCAQVSTAIFRWI